MHDITILQQIKDEYDQGLAYVQTKRQQYRERIQKRGNKSSDKISINLVANYIDVMIASVFANGPKTKFISKEGWIGQEEADNLTSVYEFDMRESMMSQIFYQKEQDKHFFGVGIVVDTGWDSTRLMPTYRTVNPLAWIPDPLPSQTGRFDAQSYRRHGFAMRTTINDLMKKGDYDVESVNKWIEQKFNSESQADRQAYASANNANIAGTLDNHSTNFVLDVYHHYTIIEGKKYLFVTDIEFTEIFKRTELKPVLKEEKLDETLVPRPVMIEYLDPERDNYLGRSVPDDIEDKQNAINILYNLNIIKAKKVAMGGDYLVNSRLIKPGQLENKSTSGKRYIYVDSFDADENTLGSAMMQLPQDNTNPDTRTAVNALKQEAIQDTKIDQMQMGIVSDKTMTKAEQQSTQANANLLLSKKNNISGWFYRDLAFQRWRSYQRNFKDGKKKFALLPSSFEWKGLEFTKDQFVTSQIPYILVGSKDDIEAKNEKLKQELLTLYPLILNDPDVLPISRKILSRMNMRLAGFTQDMIYSIYPMDADERVAKGFLEILNMGEKPKSLFQRPDAGPNFFMTCWLYLQKADDNDNKDKVLDVLQEYMIQQSIQPQQVMQENGIANSAANINMAQQAQQSGKGIVTRGDSQDTFNQ